MRRACVFTLFLCVLWLFTGCAPTNTTTRPKPPPYAEAKHLREGIKVLADKLIASTRQNKIGKIAVADFAGPGNRVTALGEHVSDKVSVALFSAGVFPDFMERKQLKEVLLSLKKEQSGYFDQETVQEFGKMIGVDSMVIGNIEDLGSFLDVTAKIVASGTGRIQGMADVRLIKDEATVGLVSKARTAALTIAVDPVARGSVVAGDKKGYLDQGMVRFTGIPYGNCQILIQPEGYEAVRRAKEIRSPTETLTIHLKRKQYDVSFQVIPPDASLWVDGKVVTLNPQGFAKVPDLRGRDYSYVVRAEGYQDRMETFNPAHKQHIALNLSTTDPFYATKSKFFEKVQHVGKRQDFSVRLWTNQTSYRVGDPIYFYFRSERDCYVTLVDFATSGEMRLIFPNRFHPDNKVRAGVTYRIPGEDYGFMFAVEPPVGRERIYAIASTRPLQIFDHDFRDEAFLTMTRGKTRDIKVMGVGVKLDKARLSAASECVIVIRK